MFTIYNHNTIITNDKRKGNIQEKKERLRIHHGVQEGGHGGYGVLRGGKVQVGR